MTPDVFVQAVVSERDRLFGGEPTPSLVPVFAHVWDEARIEEMDIPAELAVVFAKAEVRPRDRGLGIPPGPNAVHALGHQLQKELANASGAELDVVAATIVRVLARGYLYVIAVEGTDAFAGVCRNLSATADSIWATAVGNFRGDGLRKAGLGTQPLESSEGSAADFLVSELRQAEILSRRIRVVKIPKIQELGRYYLHAGGYLRIGQMDWPNGGYLGLFAQALGEQYWPYRGCATAGGRRPDGPVG